MGLAALHQSPADSHGTESREDGHGQALQCGCSFTLDLLTGKLDLCSLHAGIYWNGNWHGESRLLSSLIGRMCLPRVLRVLRITHVGTYE